MGRRTNNRSQLTSDQRDALFRAIWQALDPNGVPMRLQGLAETAKSYAGELGLLWDFYLLVSDELQRAKHAGAVALLKGRGGGWVRLDKVSPIEVANG